jgi:hypothetical protein
MFPVNDLFPRRWQASTSVVHGVDELGHPYPLKASAGGDLSVKISPLSPGDEFLTFSAFYRNFWATASAPGPVTNIKDQFGNDISNADGWIDVRRFTILMLTAAGTGLFEDEDGNLYPLDFNGKVRVERKNHIYEPISTSVLTETIDSDYHELLVDPLLPAIDLVNVAWIRIIVESNSLLGDCAFFGTIK